jgi:hypothetical protein
LSPAKGLRLFANDRKSIVNLLTIAMLSMWVVAASGFTYQQFSKHTKPSLISTDSATQLAIKAGNWNEQTLGDKKIEATLLHVKQNGFSFIVDQNTLQDTLRLGVDPLPQYENQYLWRIEFIGSGNTANGYWVTLINAETSEILMQG